MVSGWLYLDQYQKTPSSALPCFANVKKLSNANLQCQFYESSTVNPFSVDKIDLGKYHIIADSFYCTYNTNMVDCFSRS